MGHGPLRQHVLSLVDAGLVSVVEFDLKDEDGIVGYDSEVRLRDWQSPLRTQR
jgi:hypothetical protein